MQMLTYHISANNVRNIEDVQCGKFLQQFSIYRKKNLNNCLTRLRKLFKGGNQSREETFHGHTVSGIYTQSLHYAVSTSAFSTYAVFASYLHQWGNSGLFESLVQSHLCNLCVTGFFEATKIHAMGGIGVFQFHVAGNHAIFG